MVARPARPARSPRIPASRGARGRQGRRRAARRPSRSPGPRRSFEPRSNIRARTSPRSADREEVERLGVVRAQTSRAPAIVARPRDGAHRRREPATMTCGIPVETGTIGNPSTRSSRLEARRLRRPPADPRPRRRSPAGAAASTPGPAARSIRTGTSPAPQTLDRLGPDRALARERERRAERRMAGERQLRLGREDPDVVAVGPDGRHERGLGEPDLERERLHRRVVEPGGRLRDDAELVAAERRLGEHVDQPEREPASGRAYSRAMLGRIRGCSSMAEFQPSKLAMRVRFPSPALKSDEGSAVGSPPAPVAQPGQSKGLLIPRSQVRILPGALTSLQVRGGFFDSDRQEGLAAAR